MPASHLVTLAIYLIPPALSLGSDNIDFLVEGSVADPDRFGPDPDPTSENRPDPDSSK
jgi:hypothetical protein